MNKKCPFLKLGAVPTSKIAGNPKLQLVVGLCMQDECALYVVKPDGVIDKSECAITTIAKNTIL